jgi:oligopeptidase B
MSRISLSLALFCAATFAACSTTDSEMSHSETPTAPDAKQIPLELTEHGDTRVDDYFWMRLSDEQKNAETPDAQTQDVLDYLVEENDYIDAALKHTEGLQEVLFDEIVGRIKKDDTSVPVKDRGYWYYTRFEEGKEYAINCRKPAGEETKYDECTGEEEVMLDQNELAEGHDYFAVGGMGVSDDNRLLAFGVDTVSRRQYTVHFKDLSTGEMLEDEIPLTTGGATWAADNSTVFYTRRDPQTLRSYQVYRHVLGTSTEEDVLVFEETDETFSCGVYRTKSDAFLVIYSSQTLSQDYRVLSADDPTGEWQVVQPRERDLEYGISHYGDHFYIVTNWEAKNFRLMRTPVGATSKENWEEVIAHRDDVFLEGIEIFKDHLVVEERKEGLTQIRITNWDGSQDEYLEFNDPAYTAGPRSNPDFNTEILRFGYSSMTTPGSTFDHNMRTGERTLLKQQEVIDDNFSPDNYTSERLMVEVRDGVKVPVSMVYRKGTERNGENPFLLYAYGSYGSSMDPYFSSVRLSLLDRGFVYAIAHIRGGQEMGRDWYENGKLLKKQNTFNDFEDVGRAMVEMKYTSPEHFYAMGGSAGGLLMGAVMNQAPDLFNGVVAAVPFVDVVSTMLDESIPLTTFEFDEWGNPKNEEYYHYMKSYSPYDQVVAQEYPNTLVTTGYWDSQVQYWEPAKWVAKLRDYHKGDNLLLFHTNMDAGHGGQSGRFRRYRETALEYAFMMDLEGITQ